MNKDIYLKLRKNFLNKNITIKENFISGNINEEMLAELWYRQQIDRRNLKTVDNKNIIILSPGKPHTGCCPDFVDAKISVEGKIYCGDVEIHKKRSDWFKHKHSHKKEYKDVILHIFYEMDTNKIINFSLFELCLKDKIVIDKIYTTETGDHTCFPMESLCGKMLLPKDYEYLESLLISAAEARLIIKSEKFYRLFTTKNIEEQILYEEICGTYGYINNKDNFLLLARLVPINKLRKILKTEIKNKNEIVNLIESIYFGVSGFLDNIQKNFTENSDNYYLKKILKLWEGIKNKFTRQIDFSRWKFYQTRPMNYPYRRIAALSRTVANFINFRISDILCSFFRYYDNEQILTHIMNIFYQPAEGFFANRCSFTSKPLCKNFPLFGEEKVGTVILNVILPYYIYYARKCKDKNLYDKVISFYKELKIRERNKIVNQFVEKIIKYQEYRKYFFSNSIFSQGFIQIYKDFCEPIHSCCENCYLVKILSNKFKTEQNNGDFEFIRL
ncbi:MAG: DUF2851 family protein [Endomicrobia bacterium]|nr:DUF2851 family protein [Endomicrobiia bacterium]